MSEKHTTEVQFRNEKAFVKHGYNILQENIKKYNNTINKCLSVFISAFFLDTDIYDTENNVNGKLCVDECNNILFEYVIPDCGDVVNRLHIAHFTADESYIVKKDKRILYEFFNDECVEYFLSRFLVNAEYVSVWTGEGTISSKTHIDMCTKKAIILDTYDPNDIENDDGETFECNILEDEYVVIQGSKYPCHNKDDMPDAQSKQKYGPSDHIFWYE